MDDVEVRLDLTRTDEHIRSRGGVLVGEIRVRLYLENPTRLYHIEDDDTDVGPKVDVDLTRERRSPAGSAPARGGRPE